MPRKPTAKGVEDHQGIWRYRFKQRGQPRVVVSTGLEAVRANLAAAVQAMNEHKQRAILGLPEPVEAISFSDACDRFEAWKFAKHRDKPATARRVQISLRSWRERVGNRRMQDVTAEVVEDYMTWRREDDVAEVTLRKDVLAVKQLVSFATKRRWIDQDPLIGIVMPSDRASHNEVTLTVEEEKHYLKAADDLPGLGDFARIMLNQGMRDSEILNLRTEDIDFEKNTTGIVDGKSRAACRTLKMTAETRIIIGRRMSGEFVFPHLRFWRKGTYRVDESRPMAYIFILRAHNRAMEAAGLDFVIYSLRHTFATRFYDLTHNLAALQKILGHSKIDTTMRYVNDGQRRADEAMALFEEKSLALREKETVQ